MTQHFVTGGAGFVGSHLVDRLMEENNTVTVYDNLTSGEREWINHHFGKESFRFIHADLLDSEALRQSMNGHEVIWHLAANTDLRLGREITDLDLKNSTIATRNVLESMVENGISKILFSSSREVYGDAPPVPLAETSGPLLPTTLYGAGKLACEGLVSAYCHLFRIQAWIFRFANVVGARMSHGLIYDFIQKLRRNPKELEILGDGNQERPFFLVEECIDGLLCAFGNSSAQYDIFNLGCESSTSITRVAQIVTEEMGLQDVKFKYTGGKRGWPGDVLIVRFNVDKMKRFGWTAKHTADEAVRVAARELISQSSRG